jgi:hypothetical protein
MQLHPSSHNGGMQRLIVNLPVGEITAAGESNVCLTFGHRHQITRVVHISTAFFTSALLLLSSGCGDERVAGPVELLKVESSANPCGEWQVAVRAQGHGAALVLEVDGHRHREWSVEGEVDLETSGQAGPGDHLEMELVASNLRHSIEVQMPQLIASLGGTLPEPPIPASVAFPVRLGLESPCSLRIAIPWSLRVDGQELSSGRFIPGSPMVVVDIPPMEPGSHTIEASASWGSRYVSTWSKEITVQTLQPSPAP